MSLPSLIPRLRAAFLMLGPALPMLPALATPAAEPCTLVLADQGQVVAIALAEPEAQGRRRLEYRPALHDGRAGGWHTSAWLMVRPGGGPHDTGRFRFERGADVLAGHIRPLALAGEDWQLAYEIDETSGAFAGWSGHAQTRFRLLGSDEARVRAYHEAGQLTLAPRHGGC